VFKNYLLRIRGTNGEAEEEEEKKEVKASKRAN